MKAVKYALTIVVLASSLTVVAGPSCCGASKKASPNIAKKAEAVKLCVKCGEIKGTGKCCNAEAKKCSSCNLIKGSPGCCKIKDGAVSATYNAETKEIKSIVPEKKEEKIVKFNNKTCPVMGGKVNGKNFVVHNNIKYGLCCPGCETAFNADPKKYLKILNN